MVASKSLLYSACFAAFLTALLVAFFTVVFLVIFLVADFFTATFFTDFLAATFFAATFLAATFLVAFLAAFLAAFFFTAGVLDTNSSCCGALGAGVFFGLAAFVFLEFGALSTTSRGWNESFLGCLGLSLEGSAAGALDGL